MPKLLIIANMFYPDTSVASVRVTEWSRLLGDLGWECFVACRGFGYDGTPEAHAQAVRPGLRLEYLNDWSTSRWNHLLRRVSYRRVLAPDLQVVFWNSRRKRIAAIAEEWKPDVVLTSSPPHAVHIAGLQLARARGIPWVADFRDPYLFDGRFRPTGIYRAISWSHRAFERRIYRHASAILHAIPGHARWAREQYPEAADRIFFLPNGAPAGLFASADSAPRDGRRRSVRIVGYCGTDEASTVARAILALSARGFDLELRIVGRVPANADFLRSILGDRLVLTGPLTHPVALTEIAGGDILMATLSTERSSYQLLTSKLFEYLAAGRPVIVINPSEPDVEVFASAPGVEMLRSPSESEMISSLERALAAGDRAAGEQRRFIHENFRREDQAAKLSAIMNGLLHTHPGATAVREPTTGSRSSRKGSGSWCAI